MKQRFFRKLVSVLVVFCIVLTSMSFSIAADLNSTNLSDFKLITGTDFEDSSTWGFEFASSYGTAATKTVVKDTASTVAADVYYLQLTGSGGGSRTVAKTLQTPTTDPVILITFDWMPGNVTTGLNSSEVLFSDASGNSLFRLVKAGGTNGAIKYGIGNTGVDISNTNAVSGITTADGSWYSTKILFDFTAKTVSMNVYEKGSTVNGFSVSDLPLSTNVGNLNKISVTGNRYTGNTLNFTTGLDDFYIYGKSSSSSLTGNITAITTPYTTSYQKALGTTLTDIIASLPSQLSVALDNKTTATLGVNWSSANYDGSKPGTCNIEGALDLSTAKGVTNTNNIKASVSVEILAPSIPTITGFTPVYYTDFGDTTVPETLYWGFTTANATLSYSSNIGSNATTSLNFTQTNQKGGRVTTKVLPSPVNGESILVKFDWYPGTINDKGANPNENSGQFKIIDSSNNDIFTLNLTHNSEITYFKGIDKPQGTGFTNPLTWYSVEYYIDVINNTAVLKMTDKSTNEAKEFAMSMADVNYDYTVKTLKLLGVRTSGNNITWTTYIDNLGIFNIPVEANKVIMVKKIPYQRVYVGKNAEISNIGLPAEVTVRLANGTEVLVPVSEWKETDKAWNTNVAGVYKFTGTLGNEDGVDNEFNRTATCYVYNRLSPTNSERQAEWLDRSVTALKSDSGVFISWRLLADEYSKDIKFNVYKNNVKLNSEPLSVTNFTDTAGTAGDSYLVETMLNGAQSEMNSITASDKDYMSIAVQKPEPGANVIGEKFNYVMNDASVGDLDGDGKYEIIVKWYPDKQVDGTKYGSIDSSQQELTPPTLLDAYKLDGTLLWRMNLGLNLTSGAHYNQFLVFDFDGDGKSEVFIKTADGTTVYGTTNGLYDSTKIISQIGNPADNGKYVQIIDKADGTKTGGHITGGPEYVSIFKGSTGEVIDTIDYEFPVGDPLQWGDSFYNRSDRFLAGVGYLNGKTPSAILGRGYYERTTYIAYNLVDEKLQKAWSFDSAVQGKQYEGLGYHNLSIADVDNDGCDEIIAGSLTLNQDGSVLYSMDGQMGRLKGSHGDAIHVGAFDPDREGINVFGVHEESNVASIEYHDGATGESLMYYFSATDTGRGVAANITSTPGFEFWGAGNSTSPALGSGLYNVKGNVEKDKYRLLGLSVNFALYWDGDLLNELLDNVTISKYNETTGTTSALKVMTDVVSNNGTKATPTLQADIIGDWREEVVLPSTDSSELRIYSTTAPTDYRIYTLMHDPAYRNGVAWQNTAYNQPPHLGFYLGEDEATKNKVLAGGLTVPNVRYTKQTSKHKSGTTPGEATTTAPTDSNKPVLDNATGTAKVTLSDEAVKSAIANAVTDATGNKVVTIEVPKVDGATSYTISLPANTITSDGSKQNIVLKSAISTVVIPNSILSSVSSAKDVSISLTEVKKEALSQSVQSSVGDRPVVALGLAADGKEIKLNESDHVVISIPYKPTPDEVKDYEKIVIRNIDNAGNTKVVSNGKYDPATGLVTFITSNTGSYGVSFVSKEFTDTKNFDWAKKQIEVLAAKGIINGTSENTFNPEENITRADFTMLLVNTLGLTAKADSGFTDVNTSAYYSKAVSIAKELGIVSGTGDGKFNPDETISRQDMMVIIANALKKVNKLSENGKEDLTKFSDQKDISSYATQQIAALVSEGIVKGDNGSINPIGNSTRAEVAVLLYRLYYK